MTNYHFNSEKYKQASRHQKEWGQKLITELNLQGNEKILDLGCGDGTITAQLAQLVKSGQVIGIDSSINMIQAAKQLENDHLTFHLIDINQMDFSSEFNVIFSNAALHWILDHKNLLIRIFQALLPGGIIRSNFAANGNCQNFFKVIKEVITLPDYQRYFLHFIWPWYMPEIPEYEKLVRSHPFNNIRVWEENADRNFSQEDICNWIKQPSLVPFLAYLPDHLIETFTGIVIDKMLLLTRQPDGTFFETFRRINVSAQKEK